ncbi:MAG: hypothetical protein ACREPL_04955 [Rhodanobacteraceae bacterium]
MNPRATPATGLLVLAAFTSIMVLANYSRGVVAMFTFLILMATLSSVVAYMFSAMADVVLAHRSGHPLPVRDRILAFAAFGFMLWAVIGAGDDGVFWSFVLLMVGLPCTRGSWCTGTGRKLWKAAAAIGNRTSRSSRSHNTANAFGDARGTRLNFLHARGSANRGRHDGGMRRGKHAHPPPRTQRGRWSSCAARCGPNPRRTLS